ncbi:MAG TPA: hypothetical protein VJK66_02525 [Gaiellaceae bacterium]|nr:hypothetical protein [Gaiellaceae bacterium]
MADVARARYTLEIAWTVYAKDAFILGTSTIGGTHKLAVSIFDVVFSGTYDDLSEGLRSATVNRGRDSTRQFVIAGEATIRVFDAEGLMNPENASSPLQTYLVDRYQPVRLRAYDPSAPAAPVGVFYGFLEKITWTPSRRKAGAGEARLLCKDLLTWLGDARPVISATGATTTGSAIGKILDSIGWVDPMGRDLDVGDAIPDFSADGTKSAVLLIEELLIAERGIFFVSGDGAAIYQDRLARTSATSSATISNTMRALHPGVDRSRLRNRVRVKRTQTGYIATAADANSKALIGDRDLEEIETPYLPSNTQADGLAAYVLSRVKSAIPPIRSFAIDNRTQALLTQCLVRELGEVVTLTAPAADVASAQYMIESLEQRIDSRRGSHETTWLLSQHTVITPFRIGTSQLVSAAPGHVLVY